MATNILTQARLKELLHYDPATGVFTNACQRGQRGVLGAVAGHVNDARGYVRIKITGTKYFAHRLAWLHEYGVFPNMHLDHIDRNPSNNKINNLRMVTCSENMQNMGTYCGSVSGHKGVTWCSQRGKWRARISVNGKQYFLGAFDDATAASNAYLAAASKLHPNRPS